MTVSTWDKSLETGHEMIDGQHRKLIHLVDELEETSFDSYDALLNLLDRLAEFVLVHFMSEENLMMEVGYPLRPAQEMTVQHREFKAYIRLRVLEFRQEKDFDVASFQRFVGNFLKTHEFGIDKGLADWIREQEAAA